MKCLNCGNEITENQKFCSNCGNEINLKASNKVIQNNDIYL